MTLVALLSNGQYCAISADTLTTRRIDDNLEFPTRPISNMPIETRRYPSTLTSKLVLIDEHCLIGWSGSLNECIEALTLIREFRNNNLCPNALHTYVEKIYPNFNNLELLVGVYNVAGPLWRPFGNDFFPLADNSSEYEMCMLGSGVSDFYEIIDQACTTMQSKSISYEFLPTEDLICALISSHALAYSAQLLSGFGLENAWGGGFELYVCYDRFVPVDGITIRTWIVEESETPICKLLQFSLSTNFENTRWTFCSNFQADLIDEVAFHWTDPVCKNGAVNIPNLNKSAIFEIDVLCFANGKFIVELNAAKENGIFEISGGKMVGYSDIPSQALQVGINLKLDRPQTSPIYFALHKDLKILGGSAP